MFKDDQVLRKLDELLVKVNELIELERQNAQRLVRMETRMVKTMLALGLDHDGNKV